MDKYVPYKKIADYFHIQKGSIIYLAADITKLANTARKNGERFDPSVFINSFLEKLGTDGTLLIPTFNYDLRKKGYFDIINTQPITGILAQYALRQEGFLRTFNALHSFAVWGKYQNELCSIKNTDSFSEDSPFGFLYKRCATMIIIDLDLQSSLTFAHYTEQIENVKYRSFKKIPINYTFSDGHSEKIKFTLYAKKSGYINNVNPLHGIFLNKGILRSKEVNGSRLEELDLCEAHKIMQHDIRDNKAANLVYFNMKQWAKHVVKSALGRS
ncbi:MAG: AAC(3) family N-acetyltransferase [Bacteroidota bacterium]